jgi:hypothetical protein
MIRIDLLHIPDLILKLCFYTFLKQNLNSTFRKYDIIKNTSRIRCPTGYSSWTNTCFLIYINDLPEYIKHSRIRLFADDSMIYRQIKSQCDCLKLQEDLEAAIKWEQDWLMSFHPDKCNIMNITTKRNPIHFYYKMHGHIL